MSELNAALEALTHSLHRRRSLHVAPRRVLLAESDALTRSLLTSALKSFGHHVEAVETARELRHRAFQTPFDVIVSNVTLADGDGISVAGTLRSVGILAPVVIVSTHPDWDVFARAQLISSALVLSIPVDAELLNDVVSSVSRAFAGL